jgi:hypothetical protein
MARTIDIAKYIIINIKELTKLFFNNSKDFFRAFVAGKSYIKTNTFILRKEKYTL